MQAISQPACLVVKVLLPDAIMIVSVVYLYFIAIQKLMRGSVAFECQDVALERKWQPQCSRGWLFLSFMYMRSLKFQIQVLLFLKITLSECTATIIQVPINIVIDLLGD